MPLLGDILIFARMDLCLRLCPSDCVTFLKKEKSFFRCGLGECVYQFSGLYAFCLVRGRDTDGRTHITVKIRISPTAYSPPVDFENLVLSSHCKSFNLVERNKDKTEQRNQGVMLKSTRNGSF